MANYIYQKKKILDKNKDLYLDTNKFLYNRNNKEDSFLLNLNNIIISGSLIESNEGYFIEDSDAKNIYFEYNKNLGGITIPHTFIKHQRPLIVKNERKIKNRINKINIIVEGDVKTIHLEENFTNIIIGYDHDFSDEISIKLINDKKEIEYYVDKLGKINKKMNKYIITPNDLEVGYLDLRKFSDYKEVKNKVHKIDTIIVDKKIIKNRNIIREFLPFGYSPSKYFYETKNICIVDEDDMKLIPINKTYSLNGLCFENIRDGYHYIHLPNNGNDVLIYIDKTNKLKIIEKNELLKNKEIEDVSFNFLYKKNNLIVIGNLISLILIKYKNGKHKIMYFDDSYEIDDIFNKIVLDNADILYLSEQIKGYLNKNDWQSILKMNNIGNDRFSEMIKLYMKNMNILNRLREIGLSERAIKYLCDRNYTKPLLENFKNTLGTDEILSKEIEMFNNLGEEYHKLILKNNRG